MSDRNLYFWLGEDWFRVNRAGVLKRIVGGADVREPACVITDFAGAHVAHLRIDAKAGHVPTFAERRLRDQGWIDGPGRILSHALESSGSSCAGLFTAVPESVWCEQMYRLSGRAGDVVLVPWAVFDSVYCGDGEESLEHVADILAPIVQQGGSDLQVVEWVDARERRGPADGEPGGGEVAALQHEIRERAFVEFQPWTPDAYWPLVARAHAGATRRRCLLCPASCPAGSAGVGPGRSPDPAG